METDERATAESEERNNKRLRRRSRTIREQNGDARDRVSAVNHSWRATASVEHADDGKRWRRKGGTIEGQGDRRQSANEGREAPGERKRGS